MPRELVEDIPGGDTAEFDIVSDSGYRISTFLFKTSEESQANFDNIPNLKCRPDDVLLCSYPKTGTLTLYYTRCYAVRNRLWQI